MALVYLASGSPRRREILQQLGYQVERLVAEIDETPDGGETAWDYVQRMAQEKNAAAVQKWYQQCDDAPAAPIITADTTVALHNQILGKPQHAEHAQEILSALSGNTHQVLTAVCVSFQGQTESVVQSSDVCFKTLTPAEIQAYIATGEPMDKAGAYGIQGLGGVFVHHLEGSFTGVMGLPVYETCALLAKMAYVVPPFLPNLIKK